MNKYHKRHSFKEYWLENNISRILFLIAIIILSLSVLSLFINLVSYSFLLFVPITIITILVINSIYLEKSYKQENKI